MLFSRRKKLAEEYEEWVRQPLGDGSKIKDCPLSVITFLDSKGLLSGEQTARKIYRKGKELDENFDMTGLGEYIIANFLNEENEDEQN